MLFTMTSEIIKSNPDNPHLQIAALSVPCGRGFGILFSFENKSAKVEK